MILSLSLVAKNLIKGVDQKLSEAFTMSQQSLLTYPNRRFKCGMCEYTIDRVDYLKKHEALHSTKFARTLTCNACGFIARAPSMLLRHMEMHVNQKPYKCNFCDFTSNDPGNLKKHIIIHSEERPYSCNKCGYKANRQIQVRNHIGSVHENSWFSCDQCE